MAWIGNTPSQQQFVPAVDYFSGNGSTTAFTLSRPVASVLEVEAVIENVPQKPSDAYTISGNTITFTSAPPAGTSNIYVRYTSPITQVVAPSQDSVGTTQLMNGAVTAAKMANSGFEFGMRNRIINGAMTISQRIGTTQTTVADNTATYGLDRWRMFENTDGVLSVQQVSDAPVGFANSMKVTVTTADASLSAAQIGIASQRIEGFNFADFAWGTASAAPATLSFWVKSSVTGTHSGSFYDLNTSGGTRAYVFNYTVNAANTWEYKTVTVAGCTDGSWPTDSNGSLEIIFGLGTGTDYQTSSVNQWLTSFKSQSSGSVNLLNTLNATWQITGVQLEKGSTATSFDYRPYGTELALCQRYFQSFGGNASFEPCGIGQITASTQASIQLHLPVALRAANPAIGVSNPNHWYIGDAGVGGGATGITLDSASLTMVMLFVDKSAAGFTAGRAARMFANSTTSARLTISSEL